MLSNRLRIINLQSISGNINVFFNEVKKNVTEVLPIDIASVVAGYVVNEHDILFLSRVNEISQKIQDEIQSIKIKSRSNKSLYISILNLFLNNIQCLLEFYFTLTAKSYFTILFGLHGRDAQFDNLSHKQQTYLIEIGRVYECLKYTNPSVFFEFTKIQTRYNLYAVKAHVDEWETNSDIKKLFESFFNEIIPVLPNDLPPYELGFLHAQQYTTFNTSYYDSFLCLKFYDNLFKSNEFDRMNYKLRLQEKLSVISDPLKQYTQIRLAWDEIDKCGSYDTNLLREFLLFIADQGKKGIAGAFIWIVSSVNFNSLFVIKLFPLEDLFLFLHNAMKYNIGKMGESIEFFVSRLMGYLIVNDTVNLRNRVVDSFTNKINFNSYWHRIQLTVLRLIHIHHLDWAEEFALIKSDFEKNISELQEKNKLNSLASKYFIEMSEEMNKMMDVTRRSTVYISSSPVLRR